MDSRLNAITDPRILFAAAVTVFYLLSAIGKPARLAVLVALFSVLVSIAMPAVDPEYYLPLWGPLETLRLNNRYVAVGLGMAILVALKLSGQRTGRLPASAIFLLLVHMQILAKNFLGGVDVLYSLVLFVAFLIVTLVMWETIGSASTPHQLFTRYQTILTYIGLFFFAVNGVQFLLGRPATLITGGRFSGITSNPQMFTLSIAPFLPLLLHQFSTRREVWIRLACVMLGGLGLYWCFLTGSRLSLLLLVVGCGLYFRVGVPQFILLFFLGVTVFLALDIIRETFESDQMSRVLTTTDTRTQVWKGQWTTFLNNPLFGQDFRGYRVYFGESSWLGAAASLGIVGLSLILMLMGRVAILVGGARTFFRQASAGSANSLIIAIVAVAVSGSFFEAYLFGVLTLPMNVFLLTVFMLERLATIKNRRPSQEVVQPSQIRGLASAGHDS